MHREPRRKAKSVKASTWVRVRLTEEPRPAGKECERPRALLSGAAALLDDPCCFQASHRGADGSV